MSVLITSTIFIVSYWFFSCIDVVKGKRPECIAAKPPLDNPFSEDHYNDIGFPRDVCVELARNLHAKLGLTIATQPCNDLANTRTSTCLPFCGCTKWHRQKYPQTYKEVIDKAIAMAKDFSDNVHKKHKISGVQDREFMRKRVEWSISLLTASKGKKATTDLIKEIHNLAFVFCQNPEFTPYPPPESRDPVYYIYEVFEDHEFDEMVLNNENPVVVEFYMENCSFCDLLAPTLDKVIRKHGGKVHLAILDLERLPDVGNDLKVTCAPTVVSIKNQRKVNSFIKNQTEEFLDKFVSNLLKAQTNASVDDPNGPVLIERN